MDRSRRSPRSHMLALIALFFVIATALLFIVFPPHGASSTVEASLPLPTARVLPRATSARVVVPVVAAGSQGAGVKGQESGVGSQASGNATPQSESSPQPSALSPQPSALAPTLALPKPTLTATPQMLPPVPTLFDSAQSVPTLFPTPAPAAVATPAPQVPASVPARPIPILMYHYIRTVDQSIDPLGYDLSVSPDMFAAQMDWLQQNGYATVRMDALARCLNGAAVCPSKAVALTFDDGYDDAYSAAFPILQQHGFTATFYIITALVGQPHYMSWENLAALRDANMEIGAHTVDHLDMTTLDPAEDERQITQSKADLERALGVSVVSFCYPSGRYNAAIEQQVSAAGYWTATTTRQDEDWSDMFGLPRMRVVGGKPLDHFVALVGGY